MRENPAKSPLATNQAQQKTSQTHKRRQAPDERHAAQATRSATAGQSRKPADRHQF